jgi:hypothetical protein
METHAFRRGRMSLYLESNNSYHQDGLSSVTARIEDCGSSGPGSTPGLGLSSLIFSFNRLKFFREIASKSGLYGRSAIYF